MKRGIWTILIVLIAGTAFGAANLAYQNFMPSTQTTKVLGTKGFKNFSTTSLAGIQWQGQNSVTSAATSIKYRIGGFSTGNETDFQVGQSGTVWIAEGVNKVGFKSISTATATIQVNVQKQ